MKKLFKISLIVWFASLIVFEVLLIISCLLGNAHKIAPSWVNITGTTLLLYGAFAVMIWLIYELNKIIKGHNTFLKYIWEEIKEFVNK